MLNAGHGRIEGEGSDMVYIPNTVPNDFPPDEVEGLGGSNWPNWPGGSYQPGGVGAVGGIGGELVVPPIAETSANGEMQAMIGEIGDVNTPNVFSRQPCHDLHLSCASQENHQFTNSVAELVVESELQPIGDHQFPHQPPIFAPPGDGGCL